MAHRIELVGGVLAAVIGLTVAALVLALGGAARAVVITALSALGVGVSAYRHVATSSTAWLALLWASALGLLVLSVLLIFSVGILLLAAAISSLTAAAAATLRSRTNTTL